MDSKRLKVKITKKIVQFSSEGQFTKKGSYNSTSLQGKTMMSDDFELVGEDESLRQERPF